MDDFKTFDIETNATEPWRDGTRIVSWQLNDGEKLTYVDIKDRDYEKKTRLILDDLINPDQKIIIHNAVFEDYWIYVKYGVHITNFEDTMILPFVLDKGAPFEYLQGGGPAVTQVNNRRKLSSVGLKNVGPFYTGQSMESSDVIKSLGTKDDPGIVRIIRALFSNPMITDGKEAFPGKSKLLIEYGLLGDDGDMDIDKLYEFFKQYSFDDVIQPHIMWKKFREWDQPACYKTELELIPQLVELMYTGMSVDVKKLHVIKADLEGQLVTMTKEMRTLTGNQEFEPTKKADYAKELENRGHKLPISDKGRKLTGKKYLVNIEDELTDKMNVFNRAKARLTQNINGILSQSDSNGVYHPTYISCGTVHGRMASRSESL